MTWLSHNRDAPHEPVGSDDKFGAMESKTGTRVCRELTQIQRLRN